MRIAVLASGNGSNLQALIDAAEGDQKIPYKIVAVITDQIDAQALKRAETHGIANFCFVPKLFSSKAEYEEQIVACLRNYDVELIVLAGYMRIVGKTLLESYEGRMINLHPSLLPSFPGLHAQEQAIEAGVRVSGCTIHFVDQGMDTGPIIAQRVVPVYFDDDAEMLRKRIQEQEHPLIVDIVIQLARGNVMIIDRKVKIRG